MKYNILDTSKAIDISNKYQLPLFVSKVIASKSQELQDEILNNSRKQYTYEMMDESIDMIKEHMSLNNKIMICGDYDCDGILATSILYKTFQLLGYEVGYYIPNRLKDGYGINNNLIQQIIDKQYKLIITVDNGINAKEAIELALDNDIDVIITDHHECNRDLLTECLYIHPTFSTYDYYISGGAVAFDLSKNLLGYENEYLKSLAAITTISDVMPLIKGNRYLVRDALALINKNRYPQIISICDQFIDSQNIGNIIAPKINSLGRLPNLYNPNHLVKYFCSDDLTFIKAMSLKIEECNNKRKKMTSEYFEKYKDLEVSNNYIFIEEDDLHEGLIGLLASRFSNSKNCLSIVATKNNDHYKASVRSVDNLNALDIFKDNISLFRTCGGHAQALGLSYDIDKSIDIRNALDKSLKDFKVEESVYDVIDVHIDELNIDNIKSLRYFEPYGNGFEMPLYLLKNLLVVDIKSLANNHYKIKFLENNDVIEMMLFNEIDLKLAKNMYCDLIVSVGINFYRNKETSNIFIKSYINSDI